MWGRGSQTRQVYHAPFAWAIWANAWHRRCALCAEVIEPKMNLGDGKRASVALICQHCQKDIATCLVPVVLSVEQSRFPVYPAGYYQYPINHAMNRFKQQADISALKVLVHLLRQLPKPSVCQADNTVIIGTPTTPSRLRQRGFDPVRILARHLAYHWRLPICDGVVRVEDSVSQKGLGRQSRQDNVQNSFVLTANLKVRYVILFDDVLTTGATMQAMAAAIWSRYPKIKLLGVCMAHGTADFSLHQKQD